MTTSCSTVSAISLSAMSPGYTSQGCRPSSVVEEAGAGSAFVAAGAGEHPASPTAANAPVATLPVRNDRLDKVLLMMFPPFETCRALSVRLDLNDRLPAGQRLSPKAPETQYQVNHVIRF